MTGFAETAMRSNVPQTSLSLKIAVPPPTTKRGPTSFSGSTIAFQPWLPRAAIAPPSGVGWAA